MKIDLSNRVALVTGASGELGRTMARTLASCGASVALHYLKNREMAEQLREELRGRGVRTVAVQADVSVAESVEKMRDVVGNELGAPDMIVNNAVSQYRWVSVLDQPAADYEDQFRSCVLQNVLMAKAFAP